LYTDRYSDISGNYWKFDTEKPIGIFLSMSDASTAAAPAAPRPRERILTTARALFYREGIHATGVQRLADAAHVSKRTLYEYFPSKNLMVEAYLRGIEEPAGSPTSAPSTTLERRVVAC
jgi:AcrR family transcriptional regulator